MYCRLNKCCGCNSLKNGTILIGAFSVTCGTLGYYLAFIDLPDFNPVDAIATFTIPDGITESPISWIVVSTLTIVVTIPLLFAAWKKSNAGYLLPWLAVHPFLVFIGIGFQLCDGIFTDEHLIESASSIAASLIAAAIELYMFLVVYSYYHELQQRVPIATKIKQSIPYVKISTPEENLFP